MEGWQSKAKAKLDTQAAMHDEDQDDEATRRLKALLTAHTTHVYTKGDLDRPSILRLGLELVHCARAGMEYDTPTSVHIKYTHLNQKLQESIDGKVNMDKDIRGKLLAELERSKQATPDAGPNQGIAQYYSTKGKRDLEEYNNSH